MADTATPPTHSHTDGRALLRPTTRLVLPFHKRVLVQFDARLGQLTVYAGDKEIGFDEAHLFPFARGLAAQDRFEAGDAVRWSGGLDWDTVAPLLATLVAEDVLWVDQDPRLLQVQDHAPGPRPSPLEPAPCQQAANWSGSADLIGGLAGRPLPLQWLEVAVPVYRVAHMALDTDGRQVGEANVYPKGLRLPVDTQWRACLYRGDRYQAQRPMNVSALKSLRAHWFHALALLRCARDAFLARHPLGPDGWTVGLLERFTVAVLAWPGHRLVTQQGVHAAEPLPGAVSTLFRITDGLRGITHQMMFVALHEDSWDPDTPVTTVDLLDHAERNHLFHSPTGVCAGPQAMVEAFMAVVMDGDLPPDTPADVLAEVNGPAWHGWVAALPAVLDYASAGLMTHAAAYTQWPALSRVYADLWALARPWTVGAGPALAAWLARLQAHNERIDAVGHLATEPLRQGRERVYGHIHDHSARALGVPTALLSRLQPAEDAVLARLPAMVQALAACWPGQVWPEGGLEAMARVLLQHTLRVQATLAALHESQALVNRVLARAPEPGAEAFELEGRDLDITHRLAGHFPGRLPCLFEELETQLGLRIQVTRHGLTWQTTPLATPHLQMVEANTAGDPNPLGSACPFHRESLNPRSST